MPHDKIEFECTGCRCADANSLASYGDMYQPHPPGKCGILYHHIKVNSELNIVLLALKPEIYDNVKSYCVLQGSFMICENAYLNESFNSLNLLIKTIIYSPCCYHCTHS